MNIPFGRYLNARWQSHTLLLVIGLLLGVGLMLYGVLGAIWGLVPIGAAVVLLVAYFYAATTWIMQRLLDFRPIAATIWQLAALRRSDELLYVETGMRNTAIELSKFLLNGRITIIDVFNPALMPNRALSRTRQVAYENTLLPLSDPRTIWIDGGSDRIPRLDASAEVLVLDQVLSELDQFGDRQRLLQEIYRVLKPGGRLIVVERVQKPENQWVVAVAGVQGWESAESWQAFLTNNHFGVTTVEPINGLLTAFRATKPNPHPQQLEFQF